MLRTSQLPRVMPVLPMIQPSKVYKMPWHNKKQNRLCKLASPPKPPSKQIKPAKNNKTPNRSKRASRRKHSKRALRSRTSQIYRRQIKNRWLRLRHRKLIELRRVSRCQLDSLLSAIIWKYSTSNMTTWWLARSASTNNSLRRKPRRRSQGIIKISIWPCTWFHTPGPK